MQWDASGAYVAAEQILTDALSEQKKNGKLQSDVLISAANESIKRLEPYSPARDRLESALESDDSASIAEAMRTVRDNLRFRPVHEANLPTGFPTYTPVEVIEIKKYPNYRMASGSGFWTLFKHIKTNVIAMTAPVQMDLKSAENGSLRESKMAFLYGDPELGSTGPDGSVEVMDVDKTMVASVGLRGARSQKAIQDAVARLKKWVDSKSEWSVEGEPRVMGYNSPFVPNDRKYYEVQLRIVPRHGSM